MSDDHDDDPVETTEDPEGRAGGAADDADDGVVAGDAIESEAGSDGESDAEGEGDGADPDTSGTDSTKKSTVPARPSRSKAVRERPSSKSKDESKGKGKAKSGRRRRRIDGVHGVGLLVLVLTVVRVVTMVGHDGGPSTGEWVSLGALLVLLVLVGFNLLERRFGGVRSHGLPALMVILAMAVLSTGIVAFNQATPQLGLDLQGGYSVVLTAQGDPAEDTVNQAIEIIRNRIDSLGVAEPEITRQGDSVVVDLPGVQDREQAQQLVGQTAKLEFRPVLQSGLPFDAEAEKAGKDPCAAATAATSETPTGSDTPTTGGEAPPTTSAGSTPATTTGETPATTGTPTTEEEGLGAVGDGEYALGPLPRQDPTATTAPTDTADPGASTTTAPGAATTTAPAATDPAAAPTGGAGDTVVLPNQPSSDEGRYCTILGPTGIEGDALSKAQAELGGSTGSEWLVSVAVKGDKQEAANTLFNACNSGAQNCPTGQMAIVLDDEVVSAPRVNEANLASDTFVITGGTNPETGQGGFSQGEAKDLALVLRYGALPVEFVRGAERQISPTLGADSLRAGIIAGLVGLGIVILYLLFYYRALGLIVVMGMAVWSALMYGLVCWLSATQGLTLALSGVVGIVVSIGTTVDSYVVHFERLKDEVRLGKSIRASTERGFQLAFRTVLTANFAAFIGAAVLYWLTVGAVRGFAFFLGLSVLLDMFVLWMFERPMVALFARSKFFTEHPVWGVARGLGARDTDAKGATA